ncbi:MAG TPA: replicative DNA helicase, partial [Clostridium sp.]|nr:replicative DNA helicase [Clostridium sp.]
MSDSLRTMPQNIEAEQSVVGSMLIDKNAIAQAAEVLSAEDFYKDAHKTIFKAIRDLYNKDIPVDMITLVDYLKSNDMLEQAGGVTYIMEISTSVPSTANLSSYIKIVEDKSTLRRLIRSSTEIIENSYNKQDDVESVIDLAEKNIFNISEKRSTSDFEPMSTVLERGFLEIEKIF